jgi:hypothetical protein
MYEEIKSRLNSGNACYHSVQSLSFHPNVKVKIYKTIILTVLLYVYLVSHNKERADTEGV